MQELHICKKCQHSEQEQYYTYDHFCHKNLWPITGYDPQTGEAQYDADWIGLLDMQRVHKPNRSWGRMKPCTIITPKG